MSAPITLKSTTTRIIVEARIEDPALTGGVAQVIMGLASSLSALESDGEEYIFVGHDNAEDWLRDHVGGPSRLHVVRGSDLSWKRRVKRGLAHSVLEPHLRRAVDSIWTWRRSTPQMPRSDGIAESMQGDLVHFPAQSAYLTDLPTIYHPYDLQHLHFPAFFTARERAWRDCAFPLFCSRATFVPVESSWGREDFIDRLKLPLDKVVVVPIPPPTEIYKRPSDDDMRAAVEMAGFPEFAFYPAQTWPHKNHLRLLDAVAILRDEWNVRVPLILSGHRNSYSSTIEAKIAELELDDQVRFLGYVSKTQMRALYGLCSMVVVASKFEPASLPIWEAFEAGKPVACSNVAPLARQAAGAAQLFDPDDARHIAQAIRHIWRQTTVGQDLTRRGRERIGQFSWSRTARHFRALYRSALDRAMTEEDRELLRASPFI